MDIIAKKAKDCHDFSVEITEKLRALIVAEIEKALRGETSQRVLEGLLQGNTPAEKEAHLVRLKKIIMEAVQKMLNLVCFIHSKR